MGHKFAEIVFTESVQAVQEQQGSLSAYSRLHGGDNFNQILGDDEVADYKARVERGFLIHVEAFDWNCPQHITPRYSEAEVEALMAPLQDENRRLKASES